MAMGARDFIGTFETAAIAKGRDTAAGVLDALQDIAFILSVGTAADAAASHGITSPYTLSILAVESVASFLSTKYATRLSRRMSQV